MRNHLAVPLCSLLVALHFVAPPLASDAGSREGEAASVLAVLGFEKTTCPRADVEFAFRSVCARFEGTMDEFIDRWDEVTNTAAHGLEPEGAWVRARRGFYAYRDFELGGSPVRVLFMDVKPTAIVVVQDRGAMVPGERGGIPNADEVEPPRPIRKASPVYPELARQAAIEGFVVIEAIIREDGSVTDPVVLASVPEGVGFEEAAVDAVKGWRYEPARKDGSPVDVRVTANLNFTLE